MLSSLLALIERLSLFTTAATATAGLSLSLLGRAHRNMVGVTSYWLSTMTATKSLETLNDVLKSFRSQLVCWISQKLQSILTGHNRLIPPNLHNTH